MAGDPLRGLVCPGHPAPAGAQGRLPLLLRPQVTPPSPLHPSTLCPPPQLLLLILIPRPQELHSLRVQPEVGPQHGLQVHRREGGAEVVPGLSCPHAGLSII